MFFLNLTNQLAVECWNSYASDYTRPVIISANDYLSETLTNDEGFSSNENWAYGGSITIPNSTNLVWPAFNAQSPSVSFQIPLNTSIAAVPDSIYRFNPPYLIPDNANAPFEAGVIINGSSYPQPQWGLVVTNNLQVAMIDVNSGRIIDYVQLSGPNTNMYLDPSVNNIQNPGATGYNGMWVTNVNNGIPAGIANQINVSLGLFAFNVIYWNSSVNSAESEIDGFRVFYHLIPIYNVPGEASIISLAQSTNAWQVPYTPSTSFYQYITWQADDPLVHYLASDLTDTKPYSPPVNPLINVNAPNERYQPWGARMLQLTGTDPNTYNILIKDPLVFSSDFWNFPTNAFSTSGWLGQVHRGTPWQTIYLKATNILQEQDPASLFPSYGINTWMNWTGDFDATDAAAMAPVQDWHLASLLTSLLNTNKLVSLFPVNNLNPNAWQGLLNGLTASTNIPNQFDFVLISSNSSQASVIANAIQSGRTVRPGQFFNEVGDILATPQLAEQSPFLTGLDATTGISDAAYELIASQLLPRLCADSVGSVGVANNQPLVQFTGYDGHAYAIQMSSDLVNWSSISTNCPVNGVIIFTNSATLNANQQFYRSVLLQ